MDGPRIARGSFTLLQKRPRLVARGAVEFVNLQLWQRFSRVERVTGIEPALSAWEADVLPLNYTRERADGAYSRGAIGSLTDSCAAPRSTSGA